MKGPHKAKESTGLRLNSGESNDANSLFLPFSRGRFPSSCPVPIPGVPQQRIMPEEDTLLHQKLLAYSSERCPFWYRDQDLAGYVDNIVNYLFAVTYKSRRLYDRYIIPLSGMPQCIRKQLITHTCSWLAQEMSPVDLNARVDVRRKQFQRQQYFVNAVKLVLFPGFSCSYSDVDKHIERFSKEHGIELREIIKDLSAPALAAAPVSENNNKSWRRL